MITGQDDKGAGGVAWQWSTCFTLPRDRPVTDRGNTASTVAERGVGVKLDRRTEGVRAGSAGVLLSPRRAFLLQNGWLAQPAISSQRISQFIYRAFVDSSFPSFRQCIETSLRSYPIATLPFTQNVNRWVSDIGVPGSLQVCHIGRRSDLRLFAEAVIAGDQGKEG